MKGRGGGAVEESLSEIREATGASEQAGRTNAQGLKEVIEWHSNPRERDRIEGIKQRIVVHKEDAFNGDLCGGGNNDMRRVKLGTWTVAGSGLVRLETPRSDLISRPQ